MKNPKFSLFSRSHSDRARRAALAQTYPTKPIRMSFPSARRQQRRGRRICFQLTDRIGKSVVVDNQAAGGSSHETWRSAPDGYTLLLIWSRTRSALDVQAPLRSDRGFARVSILAPAGRAVRERQAAGEFARRLLALAKRSRAS